MSSFGLLVSNILSSFIIEYHKLFSISYIIPDKNALAFREWFSERVSYLASLYSSEMKKGEAYKLPLRL
jgi:hypothetical protein